MQYQDILHARIIPAQIIPLVQKAAQNNVPVLIQGEQGVGKEWVAKGHSPNGRMEIPPFL